MNQYALDAFKKILRDELQKVFKKPVAQRSMSTYQMTERILYSYEALKIKIASDKEELQNEQPIHMPRRSCDIVKFSSGTSFLAMEIQDKIEERKRSMERTEREVRRIENALATIRDDEYYEVIELKYFQQMTDEDIAEDMQCDRTTVTRHRKRLLNRLEIMFCGADALK